MSVSMREPLTEATIHRIAFQPQTCAAGTFQAQYFNNATLSGSPALTRCDAAVTTGRRVT